MSKRDSGVFYYSEVVEPADGLRDDKLHGSASFKNPKMKSPDSLKNINFKVMNNTIAGKANGSLASTPSSKSTLPTSTIPIAITASAPPPDSPSRSRSASTPPPSTPESLRAVPSLHKSMNTITAISEEMNGKMGAPPSYDSHKEEQAPSDPTKAVTSVSLQHIPLESPRRYSMEDSIKSQEVTGIKKSQELKGSADSEDSPRESPRESPRGPRGSRGGKDYLSEHETSSSREPSRRAVRHTLSRMSSLPNKDALTSDRNRETNGASPQQTRTAKVLKRNPSFWEVDAKKGKNQMTLRRYTDVGIVTVSLNVSGTIFSTSTNTLLREPETLFATILEREEASIKAGKQIFLDRNPTYFSPILDYMRTGNFDRDTHIKYAKSIMIEAEFFKVKGLIKILHDIPELSRVQLLQLINSTEKPKLRGLWLPTVNLAGLDLSRANLDFTQLARSNLRNILLSGASLCNSSLIDVNLRNAVLNHSSIAHTDFSRANLSNANLRFVKCQRCDFTDADLSYCVFEGADFQMCDFSGANLSGADFTSSDLSNSTFRNAIFSEETVFGNTITKNVEYEGSNIEITKKKGGVFAMLGKKKKG